MAVPSRIFVGLTVFGLICTFLLVPVTLLVLLGVRTPSYFLDFDSKVQSFGLGQKIFLVLASLFAVAFTVLSWRALLAGARRQSALRGEVEAKKKERNEGPPPGYM